MMPHMPSRPACSLCWKRVALLCLALCLASFTQVVGASATTRESPPWTSAETTSRISSSSRGANIASSHYLRHQRQPQQQVPPKQQQSLPDDHHVKQAKTEKQQLLQERNHGLPRGQQLEQKKTPAHQLPLRQLMKDDKKKDKEKDKDKDKDKKNHKEGFKKTPGPDFSEEDPFLYTNEFGIIERRPCVEWSTVSHQQKLNWNTDSACSESDLMHGYPYDKGCCRSYFWLLYDPTGSSYPSVPCICNQYTRDPNTFPAGVDNTNGGTVNAPGQPTQLDLTGPNPIPPSGPTPTLVVSPTPKPPTAPPPTPKPPTMTPPTPKPPTPQPPTGVSPTATREPPVKPAADTCANPANNQYWNVEAFPWMETKTKCRASIDCPDPNNEGNCCLAKYCFCGLHIAGARDQECVPDSTSSNNDDANTNNENANVDNDSGISNIDSNADVVSSVDDNSSLGSDNTSSNKGIFTASTCTNPDNHAYWDMPGYSNKQKCTGASDCKGANSCCLGKYCLCGAFRTDKKDQECLPEATAGGTVEKPKPVNVPGSLDEMVPAPAPPTAAAKPVPTNADSAPEPVKVTETAVISEPAQEPEPANIVEPANDVPDPVSTVGTVRPDTTPVPTKEPTQSIPAVEPANQLPEPVSLVDSTEPDPSPVPTKEPSQSIPANEPANKVQDPATTTPEPANPGPVPSTEPPKPAPISIPKPGSGVAPAKDTCAVADNNRFWDATKYPYYASRTKCTTTKDCAFTGPQRCCLAEFCLCGVYRAPFVVEECVPE